MCKFVMERSKGESVKDKRQCTQIEIKEIWFKHKMFFSSKHWKKGWVGLDNLQRSLPSSTRQVECSGTGVLLAYPSCTFLHIHGITSSVHSFPLNSHDFIQVIAWENSPSWKEPTGMIKSDSWLCTEPPKTITRVVRLCLNWQIFGCLLWLPHFLS